MNHTAETRARIGESVRRSFTPERRALQSRVITEAWAGKQDERINFYADALTLLGSTQVWDFAVHLGLSEQMARVWLKRLCARGLAVERGEPRRGAPKTYAPTRHALKITKTIEEEDQR